MDWDLLAQNRAEYLNFENTVITYGLYKSSIQFFDQLELYKRAP
jgi:hypothetical protein